MNFPSISRQIFHLMVSSSTECRRSLRIWSQSLYLESGQSEGPFFQWLGLVTVDVSNSECWQICLAGLLAVSCSSIPMFNACLVYSPLNCRHCGGIVHFQSNPNLKPWPSDIPTGRWVPFDLLGRPFQNLINHERPGDKPGLLLKFHGLHMTALSLQIQMYKLVQTQSGSCVCVCLRVSIYSWKVVCVCMCDYTYYIYNR